MHETRKAAKDARYAAEAAALADRKKYRRSVRRMKKLQGTLGDQHDAVVARDTARDIGIRAHLAGENAFSFGLLHEGCQRDALMLEKQAMKSGRRHSGRSRGPCLGLPATRSAASYRRCAALTEIARSAGRHWLAPVPRSGGSVPRLAILRPVSWHSASACRASRRNSRTCLSAVRALLPIHHLCPETDQLRGTRKSRRPAAMTTTT